MPLPYSFYHYRSNESSGTQEALRHAIRHVTHWLAALRPYIRGSMPRTGWFFSVSQFSGSSQSVVMVSSAM